MDKFIPLSTPNLNGRELEYIAKEINEGWVSTAGPCTSKFEDKLAEYVGISGAVACQSGTAGLHLALQVCGIGQDDEVLVPTLTFAATVNPVRYLGAYPVFMDCDDSLCMDPEKVAEFCENCCDFNGGRLVNRKNGRQIKALIVVHVFGNLADMDQFIKLAKRFNLKLIEDACEALGSRFSDGKFAGTIGDIGVYSFNGNKIITTGSGGMVVSDNTDYLNECRHLSTQAKTDQVYFVHDKIGYNYRMTNLQSAMGLAQLEQLEEFIEIKKRNYKKYLKLGLELLPFKQGIRPNYWFYSLTTSKRDEIIKFFAQNKVQARPIWKLLHTLEPYAECENYRIKKAVVYYSKIVNIPCSSGLSDEDLETVAKLVKEFEGNQYEVLQ